MDPRGGETEPASKPRTSKRRREEEQHLPGRTGRSKREPNLPGAGALQQRGVGGVDTKKAYIARYFLKSLQPKRNGLFRGCVVTMEEEGEVDKTGLSGYYDDLKRLERQSHSSSSFTQVMTVFADASVPNGAIAFIEDIDLTLFEYLEKMSVDECFERSRNLFVVDFSETIRHIIRQLVAGLLHLENEKLCFDGSFSNDVYVKFRHMETMPEIKFSKVNDVYDGINDWQLLGQFLDMILLKRNHSRRLYPSGEAWDLVSALEAGEISSMEDLDKHPAMWSSEKRVEFIDELNSMIQSERRKYGSKPLTARVTKKLNKAFRDITWQDMVLGYRSAVELDCTDEYGKLVQYNEATRFIRAFRNSVQHVKTNEKNKANFGSKLGMDQFFRMLYMKMLVDMVKAVRKVDPNTPF